MKRINENTLAKDVAKNEGGHQELSIAQIKEVIRLTLDELAENYYPYQAMELLERHGI